MIIVVKISADPVIADDLQLSSDFNQVVVDPSSPFLLLS